MSISAVSTPAASILNTNNKLSLEEQQYDTDNNGTLSITEKAALQAAQSQSNQSVSAARERGSIVDTVEISKEAQSLLLASQQPRA
jgi:hypothetical protein